MIGPYQYTDMNYKKVYGAFMDVKNEWDKDSGRMYTHSVLSFPKDENITPEQALEFGIRFAEKTYSGFQTVVAVHTDKEHIHCHMVVNTVSYLDGHKLQKSRKDLKADKEYCNDLCLEYGLSVAEKGKHADGTEIEEGEIIAWDKNKYRLLAGERKSYLADCGIAAATALMKSTTKEQFLSLMKEQGWEVQWSDSRKHITFVNADGKKVRDTNLEKTFNLPISKEAIAREFERKAERTRRPDRRTAERKSDAPGGKPETEHRNKRIAKSRRNASAQFH